MRTEPSRRDPTPRGHRHGGKGNKLITRIVLHSTVGPTKPGSARDIAHMFNTASRAASAHYPVDAGEVVQDLYDSYVAYHAPPNSGSLGVEICDRPGPSESQPNSVARWATGDHRKALLLTAELVAGLCSAYDIPIRKLSPADLRAGRKGICGHIDVSHAWWQTNHWAPGKFPWTEFIRLVKKAANGHDVGAETIDPGDTGSASGGGSSSTYTVVSVTAPLGLHDKDGARRTRVKDWQTDALGYDEEAADGFFAPGTESDTKSLQEQIGVKADGLVGDETMAAWKKAGKPKLGKSAPVKPSKGKPAPSKAKPFPWPDGHYIGPKDGPNGSHSGFYNGDDKQVKALIDQLVDRGWDAGKGGDYLTKYGNDGRYCADLEALIRAFQRDQGLDVDGLGGKQVWDAAFKSPVT